MTPSRRSRRQWRIFFRVSLASAMVSGYFGYLNRAGTDPSLRSIAEGICASLLIATPILLLEMKGDRVPWLRRLRRLPLAVYFAVKILFYFVVIVGGILLMRFAFTPDLAHLGRVDAIFRRSLIFAIAMSVLANLVFDMGALLGFGTLKNLLTGRYVQPRREQRAFLLIDMKNSTGMAERLGAIRFHELLNDFFNDVSDAALECDAEIHKYVGDEAILTWPDDGTGSDSEGLLCPFLAQDLIDKKGEYYRNRYGTVPEFRAALHRGEIVAGEIGDVRREIAFVGDTLNVTARLLEAAKATGHDVLVSDDVLRHANLPANLQATKLPVMEVRGRSAPLSIAALSRSDRSGRSLPQAAAFEQASQDPLG